MTSWWLNQPIWKICSSNWIISPGIGLKNKKWLKPPPSIAIVAIVIIHVAGVFFGKKNPPRVNCWTNGWITGPLAFQNSCLTPVMLRILLLTMIGWLHLTHRERYVFQTAATPRSLASAFSGLGQEIVENSKDWWLVSRLEMGSCYTLQNEPMSPEEGWVLKRKLHLLANHFQQIC